VVIAVVPRLSALLALQALDRESTGLFELIRHQGTSVGLDNYRSVLHDEIFWAHAAAHRRLHRSETSGLTIVFGMLIALLLVRLSTWVRVLLTSGLVLVWSMAGRRRGAGLVLDDELRETASSNYVPVTHRDRRLLPARLVRDDVLAAQHGHAC